MIDEPEQLRPEQLRRLRAIAHEEIQRAAVRFIARTGGEDYAEVFEGALCHWLTTYFDAIVEPPTPAQAAEAARAWDDALRQAKADLELQSEGDGG